MCCITGYAMNDQLRLRLSECPHASMISKDLSSHSLLGETVFLRVTLPSFPQSHGSE